jgi:phenylpyruvate tautomerase PptA (4-oxalocrotonate tautomerase family)
MKRFFVASLSVLLLSGIVVAQKTRTDATADASNRTSVQKQGRQIDLLSETQLAAQLQSALDARHAKVGDRVILKTTEAIKQNGKVAIPKGAQLIGRVTDVQQRTKETGESHISVLIDQLHSGSIDMPITTQILSITQARSQTQANNSSVDTELLNQSSAGTRSTAPPRNSNGGGLLGGVGSAVGGVANTTTSTVGNVAGTTTNAVGSTVSTTTNTAGNLSGSLRGLQISQSTSASAQSGSTLTLTGGNLRLDSGTTFNLAISNSASAGNP